jgi:hypothetical protein
LRDDARDDHVSRWKARSHWMRSNAGAPSGSSTLNTGPTVRHVAANGATLPIHTILDVGTERVLAVIHLDKGQSVREIESD